MGAARSTTKLFPVSEDKLTATDAADDDKLFANTFNYISKNKIVNPDNLQRINAEHSKEIDELYNAIKTGDEKAKIFSDSKCELFILCLIQSKKISYWQGMNVYVYLLLLMQYKKGYPLKEEDQRLKEEDRNFRVIQMVKDNKLTEEGEKYLSEIIELHKIIHIDIDREKFIEFLLSEKLGPTDRWLFQFEFHNIDYRSPIEEQTKIDIKDRIRATDSLYNDHLFVDNDAKAHAAIPWFSFEKLSQRLFSLTIPSMPVINYLNNLNKDPYQFQPSFGRISDATLRRLHASGKQPLALYNRHVKNNHEGEGGPFTAFMHDLAHGSDGSLFTSNDRDYFFNKILPPFIDIYDKTSDSDFDIEELRSEFNHSISVVTDLVVTNLRKYSDPEKRKETMLSELFVPPSSFKDFGNSVTFMFTAVLLILLLYKKFPDDVQSLLMSMYWPKNQTEEQVRKKLSQFRFFEKVSEICRSSSTNEIDHADARVKCQRGSDR